MGLHLNSRPGPVKLEDLRNRANTEKQRSGGCKQSDSHATDLTEDIKKKKKKPEQIRAKEARISPCPVGICGS